MCTTVKVGGRQHNCAVQPSLCILEMDYDSTIGSGSQSFVCLYQVSAEVQHGADGTQIGGSMSVTEESCSGKTGACTLRVQRGTRPIRRLIMNGLDPTNNDLEKNNDL